MVTKLSTFWNAVKPKERTDQYAILSALYELGAYRTPVTSTQVKTLLDLHLGKKIPVNIPARLRKYSAYVEPVKPTGKLMWKLTDVGIQKLRDVSGLALRTKTSSESFDADVAIVCALESEFDAVCTAFGGQNAWKTVGETRFVHVYRETTLATTSGQNLKVVATVATSMGLTAAAIATTQLVFSFRPKLVIMVGIAAGTRAGGKQFGDVLVADPSVDYASGKFAVSDGEREFQPDSYPLGLDARLRSVLQKYRRDTEIFARIRSRWSGRLPERENRLHIGPLGAADQVIDDAKRVEEITRLWRKLVGVEMETYAVYRACHESPAPKPRFVSFKAVCDFAAEKGDAWQDYAAFTAAEFAHDFLESQWDALWPRSEMT